MSITQTAAATACSNLGTGYHLMTNNEWMTVASIAVSTAGNWSSGTVGSGAVASGNTGSVTSNACAAATADGDAYVSASCTASGTGTFSTRRTHFLANSSVIWDLAGNVDQWINYTNVSDKPTPATAAWYEYTAISGSATTPRTQLEPLRSPQTALI